MRLFHLALLGTLTITAACGSKVSTSTLAMTDTASPMQQTPAQNDPTKEEWVDLFNGKDLNDWTVKFAGHPAGENLLDTFQVQDGLLRVRYDHWEVFGDQFGHIVYNGGPYSHYKLIVEYRFIDEQVFVDESVRGDAAWAIRNNGIMYHSQSAAEMGLAQEFPTCMEYQLLGGDGVNPRTTANLCTPSTKVVIDGELREDHCIISNSKTYHGDQWVTAELVVHGSDRAQHILEGKVVMEYTDLQLDDGTPRASGYIALQAETAPTDFRTVRLLNLEGCMDANAKNYKSYFVKSKPDSCVF